jgi:hypothetical protein
LIMVVSGFPVSFMCFFFPSGFFVIVLTFRVWFVYGGFCFVPSCRVFRVEGSAGSFSPLVPI